MVSSDYSSLSSLTTTPFSSTTSNKGVTSMMGALSLKSTQPTPSSTAATAAAATAVFTTSAVMEAATLTFPPDRKYKLSEASVKDKADWDFMFNNRLASHLKDPNLTVTEMFVTPDKKFSVVNTTGYPITFDRIEDSFAITFNGVYVKETYENKTTLFAKKFIHFQNGEKFLFFIGESRVDKTDRLCIYNINAGAKTTKAFSFEDPLKPAFIIDVVAEPKK